MFALSTPYLRPTAPATLAVTAVAGVLFAVAMIIGLLRVPWRRGPRAGSVSALPACQVERVRRIHATFAEHDAQTFEERLDDFRHHPARERELATWERMAGAYERFVARRSLSLPARNEVFKLVLLRSLALSDAEVLRRQALRFLSRQDAVEVLLAYGLRPRSRDRSGVARRA